MSCPDHPRDEGVIPWAHGASASEISLPPLTPGPHRKRIGLISIVACFGGLLFGYDTGVSNGAERPMQIELGLSDLQLGLVISSLVFAAAIGAVLGGRLSDSWGRRKTIILLAVLFFVGTLFVVLSPNYAVLVLGRVMLGLGVGGASTVVPVYLAELAPFEIRGSITGRNELAIVSGQLLAFTMNVIINIVWATTTASGGSCSRSARCPRSPCSSACCGCRSRRAGSSTSGATTTLSPS